METESTSSATPVQASSTPASSPRTTNKGRGSGGSGGFGNSKKGGKKDQTATSSSVRNKRQKKPDSSTQDPESKNSKNTKPTPRFLELHKLVKNYHPTSINGAPITSLSVPLPRFLNDLVATTSDIYLNYEIKPSDPDFPFDLDVLKFSLFVPTGYPFYQNRDKKPSRPAIHVLNDNIPRGFSLNIEAGFNEIIDKCVEMKAQGKKAKRNRQKKSNTKPNEANNNDNEEDGNDEEEPEAGLQLVQGTDLTSIVATLMKNLEVFLKREKKETIKIVRIKKNADHKARSSSPMPETIIESPRPTPTPPPMKKQINVPPHIAASRDKEIKKFKQRLQKQLNVRKFSSTAFNDIFSLDITLDKPLVVDEENGLSVSSIPCRAYIPTDYLFNDAKPIKLDIDKNFIVDKVSRYEDSATRLVVSRKFHQLCNNFNNIAAANFLEQNIRQEQQHEKEVTTSTTTTSWKISLTSQLNFFVQNCSALLADNFEMSLI